jgi:hypothetical protein
MLETQQNGIIETTKQKKEAVSGVTASYSILVETIEWTLAKSSRSYGVALSITWRIVITIRQISPTPWPATGLGTRRK